MRKTENHKKVWSFFLMTKVSFNLHIKKLFNISEQEASRTIVQFKKVLSTEVSKAEGKLTLRQLRSKRGVSINLPPVSLM